MIWQPKHTIFQYFLPLSLSSSTTDIDSKCVYKSRTNTCKNFNTHSTLQPKCTWCSSNSIFVAKFKWPMHAHHLYTTHTTMTIKQINKVKIDWNYAKKKIQHKTMMIFSISLSWNEWYLFYAHDQINSHVWQTHHTKIKYKINQRIHRVIKCAAVFFN